MFDKVADDLDFLLAENARLTARLASLEGQKLKLREALSWFVDDPRFDVQVGGNPQAVQRMVEEASAVYISFLEEP
jgi:hypothetical protein